MMVAFVIGCTMLIGLAFGFAAGYERAERDRCSTDDLVAQYERGQRASR